MPDSPSQPPGVFISYSQDSPEHKARVRALADRLIQEGVDCVIDQYEPAPKDGWPRWMDRQIRDAAYVLVVCTHLYYSKVMGEVMPGTGLGAQWEGNIIYNKMYQSGARTSKFIPVLFSDGVEADIPVPLQGQTYYRVDTDSGYDALYRQLTSQPALVRPPLGQLRSLPPVNSADILSQGYTVTPGAPNDLWQRIQGEVFYVGQLVPATRPPLLMIATAPRTQVAPIDLKNQLAQRFIQICHHIGIRGHLVRDVGTLCFRARDDDELNNGRIFAWAHDDGAIGFNLDLPCATTESAERLMDVLELWVIIGRVILEASTWPTQICGSGPSLRYRIMIGNLADAVLTLNPALGPVGNTLSLPTAGTPAYRNRRPTYDEAGVCDSTTGVDGVVEQYLTGLARILQCDWFEDRLLVLRDMVKLGEANGMR